MIQKVRHTSGPHKSYAYRRQRAQRVLGSVGRLLLAVALLWAAYGLLQNRLMAWLQPTLAHRQLPAVPLNSDSLQLSLHEVLAQHRIKGLRNFRLVSMNGHLYYQLKSTFNHLAYFETNNGNVLPDGDAQYALSLARYFSGDEQSEVQVEPVKSFSTAYPAAQRLLPVYQLSFNRPDGLVMFVDTRQSRLADYSNRYTRAARRVDHLLYQNSHALGLSHADRQTGLLLALLACGLLAAGVTIRPPAWAGRYVTPAIFSAVGLLLAVNIYTRQLARPAAAEYEDDENVILGIDEIALPTTALPWREKQLYNASLVKMPQGIFYQLFAYTEGQTPEILYMHAGTGAWLPDGDFIYARYLANQFKEFRRKIDAGVSFSCCLPQDTIPDGTELKKAGIVATTRLTHFNSDYPARQKRLPVVKVTYEKPAHTSFYVETASSSLADIRYQGLP